MKQLYRLGAVAILLGFAGAARAQTIVPVPDQSQTTTLIAQVGEQVTINVPATVTFAVNNVAAATNASANIALTNIVLSSATRQVTLEVQAVAAAFTPPVAGANTWSAGDVSWSANGWVNGTGAGSAALTTSYQPVVTGNANALSVTNPAMQFTLAANTNVNRSGSHTLQIRWRVDAVGL